MTDDDQNSPEPTDEPGQRPSPDQLAAMRAAMSSPQFKDQMAQFTQNVGALSGFSDAYAKAMAESMRPMAESIRRWQEQQKSLSSDFFKTVALTQMNLDSVASQLVRNVDFKSISEGLAAFQFALTESIAPILKNFRSAFYPPNLRDIEGIQFEQVEQVVMVDGISLYGVPRAEAAASLIRAAGATERRKVLVSQWPIIAADCRASLDEYVDSDLSDLVIAARAALDAFDAGHERAAQALAASLIDAVLQGHIDGYRTFLPDKSGARPEIYDELSARQAIAFLPLLQAYQRFFPKNGDEVPEVFNRHASAHTVSPVQYKRCNAIQGLLLACSLIFFLDERAASAAA